MGNGWWSVIFFGGLAGLAVLAGMYLVMSREKWCRRHSARLIAFAAGIMLGVGFFHILPEAQELTAHATAYLVIAFVIFYFLEHHLHFHADHESLHHHNLHVPNGHDAGCDDPHPLGLVAFCGMGLHSLVDGLIIGAGFGIDRHIGLLSAAAVIAHKVPAGVSMFSILVHYGHRKASAATYTAIVAAATPIGAIFAYALAGGLRPAAMGILMALAAGSFIYIAASDLIPESHRARGGLKGTIALCGGLLAALGAGGLAH